VLPVAICWREHEAFNLFAKASWLIIPYLVYAANHSIKHIIITGASVTTTTTASTFGLGSGPVFLSDVHCTGSEATLLDCPHTIIALGSHCTHNRDVGVRCEGEFKLRMSY
jgi:hypothetical protein